MKAILTVNIVTVALVLGICGLAVAQGEKADPVGTWKCEYKIGDQQRTADLTIKKDGDKLAGTMSWPEQKDEKLKDVKLTDGTLTFSAVRKFMDNEIPIDYKLTIDGDKLKGTGAAEFGGQKQEFDIEGKREKQEGAKESSAEPAKLLLGAWQLKEAKNPGTPSGIGTRLKLFTGTHWCVIQPDPASGKIVFQHGGHYSFDGKVLSETIDFAGDSTSSLIGKTFKLELKITADALEQLDAEGVFNEKWERAKAAQ